MTFRNKKRCCMTAEGYNALHVPIEWRGTIVGESRDKKCWWVTWDMHSAKTRYCYHKDFIEILPAKS